MIRYDYCDNCGQRTVLTATGFNRDSVCTVCYPMQAFNNKHYINWVAQEASRRKATLAKYVEIKKTATKPLKDAVSSLDIHREMYDIISPTPDPRPRDPRIDPRSNIESNMSNMETFYNTYIRNQGRHENEASS